MYTSFLQHMLVAMDALEMMLIFADDGGEGKGSLTDVWIPCCCIKMQKLQLLCVFEGQLNMYL